MVQVDTGAPRSLTECSGVRRALLPVLVLLGVAVGLLSTATTTLGADADTEVLELQPGDNFIGWVAEPIAVDDVFEQIPAASLIYTWNADSRSWQYAIREVGGTLETLQPGMAAKIRIEGRRTVRWERPLTPAKGMVTLYSGENWVAWNGRDEWPLDQVARGIGSSLVSIEVEERGIVYQPGSSISEAIAPLNGESTLRRGDALRVTVNRDLRWLQPTGMMPNIVWVGEISRSLKDKIGADILRVVNLFADEFAVETDFSDTTILVYNGVDAAVAYAESGATPRFNSPPEELRVSLTNHHLAAATPWGFYVHACGWRTRCPSHGRHGAGIQDLVHEYFHHVQRQIPTDGGLSALPSWMLEGVAVWSEWQLPNGLRSDPWESERKLRLDYVTRTSVSLESAEEINTPWEYTLGAFAAEQLAERSGADAHIEHLRLLHPQIAGAERRWVQEPTWPEAFQTAFGIHITDFYQEFADWRETLPTPARRYDYEPNDVTLSGVVQHSDGSPATGFRLNTAAYQGEHKAGSTRATIVDSDGKFSIDVTPETMQRIWLTRDGCTLWHTNDGLTTGRPQPGQYRDLDSNNLPVLNLTLPEGACENPLRANITRLRDDPRYLDVLLIDYETHRWTHVPHQSSGAYVGYAPKPGKYLLRVRIDGCGVYYANGGIVASRQDADVLELGKEPVSVEFRISDTLCTQQLHGRVVDEEGIGHSGVWVNASRGHAESAEQAASAGEFSITVPDSGEYVLQVWTGAAGCWIRYSESGATTDWNRATRITVADEDVTDIEFIVPDDPSSLCR